VPDGREFDSPQLHLQVFGRALAYAKAQTTSLDAGTAQILASSTSSDGMVLGSTKTSGAEGVHHLAPVSVAHLRNRRAAQQLERDAPRTEWREHVYDGEKLSMVFTAAHGGLDLADVARHVGHSDPSTTAEYVRSLGRRFLSAIMRAHPAGHATVERLDGETVRSIISGGLRCGRCWEDPAHHRNGM